MIQIKNVTFHYAGGQTQGMIQNINLTIEEGEVILLCGASGSGKTTITRLINGLIPHFYEGELSGEIRIDGKEISKQPLYETAKKVGSVFQNPRSQFFNVDTTSELAFGCENIGMDEAEINERIFHTVKQMRLESIIDRSIFNLSGGEKQKVACSCVAVSNPDIIVLDEPSSNLDEETIMDLRQYIKHWKKQKKTIVISEHRLSYIWDLADHVVLLKSGQIVLEKKGHLKETITKEELASWGLRTIEKKRINQIQTIVNQKAVLKKSSIREELVLKDFAFSYKNGREVFNIPKLRLPLNEITGIIGANGIGKSTFLRCLCGLEKKCKGTVSINGTVSKIKERRKSIFMVMQDVNHQLFTESVMEEVLLSMGQENEDAALEILRQLDLEELKDRHPASLSGGQKQRVAVASAVASGRKIILFDEPTSGLDYGHMQEIAELFKMLKRSGTSIFVVTHDAELVEKCCTAVVSLEDTMLGKKGIYEKGVKYQATI